MLTITKRNGNTALYDRSKIASSILNANAAHWIEIVSQTTAEQIADSAIGSLVATHSIISTADIREAVYEKLVEAGYFSTAESYLDYNVNK